MAGAPISWGVCEVPGWGYQLPADRVLAEMRDLGLTATEFGPDGYLPRTRASGPLLAEHGLRRGRRLRACRAARARHRPAGEVDRALDALAPRPGTPVLVLAAATGAGRL